MRVGFYFLFIFGMLSLFGEGPFPISFIELEKMRLIAEDVPLEHWPKDKFQKIHEKEIQISGFLYQKESGKWILASQPNLKSCCIGSRDRIFQQIALADDFQIKG